MQKLHGKVVTNEVIAYFDTIGVYLTGRLTNCLLKPITGNVIITAEKSGEKTILISNSTSGYPAGVFRGWLKRDLGIDGPYSVLITSPGYSDFTLSNYRFNGGDCRFEVILGDSQKRKLTPKNRRQ
ncbi:MAG: hypothetical protein H7330_01310 [Hymenobacteraceae bacterium]|nr:hypothetical protein [Hymenobacteraceae bacterium]